MIMVTKSIEISFPKMRMVLRIFASKSYVVAFAIGKLSGNPIFRESQFFEGRVLKPLYFNGRLEPRLMTMLGHLPVAMRELRQLLENRNVNGLSVLRYRFGGFSRISP